MDDRNAPAAKADLAVLEQKIDQKIEMLRGEVHDGYDDLKETLRDSETKLLKAFYSFAETNPQRLTATERESAALRDRLATVESRLTEVEKRLNIPPTM